MDFELSTFSKKEIESKRQEAPTICVVCLGNAKGHHYDVPSCHGCKTFFRRNIITKRRYTCLFDNKCFDDLSHGKPSKKCRACRYKKCVKVGMNSEAIQNALKHEGFVEKPRQTIDVQVGILIENMLRLDGQSEKFRDCEYNPKSYQSLKECVEKDTSILSFADKYKPIQGWPLQRKTLENNKHPPILKNWRNFQLLIEVELAKALPFYSNLSNSDRFYLLQDTLMMSTNLTKAFYSFEQKSDKLLRPDGLLFYDKPFLFHDEFRNCIRNDLGMRCLAPILRNGLDRVEFVLLRVLVLTNPAVSRISEDARKYLTKERQKYNIALFRYIMIKHGASGPTRFANIIGLINVLEHQQKDQRDLGIIMTLEMPKRHLTTIFDEVMNH